MTQTQDPVPDRNLEKERIARRRRKLEEQLDKALADTFPASDPVAIVTSQTEESWSEEDTKLCDPDEERPATPRH